MADGRGIFFVAERSGTKFRMPRGAGFRRGCAPWRNRANTIPLLNPVRQGRECKHDMWVEIFHCEDCVQDDISRELAFCPPPRRVGASIPRFTFRMTSKDKILDNPLRRLANVQNDRCRIPAGNRKALIPARRTGERRSQTRPYRVVVNGGEDSGEEPQSLNPRSARDRRPRWDGPLKRNSEMEKPVNNHRLFIILTIRAPTNERCEESCAIGQR
jgi:hypothetical protein